MQISSLPTTPGGLGESWNCWSQTHTLDICPRGSLEQAKMQLLLVLLSFGEQFKNCEINRENDYIFLILFYFELWDDTYIFKKLKKITEGDFSTQFLDILTFTKVPCYCWLTSFFIKTWKPFQFPDSQKMKSLNFKE